MKTHQQENETTGVERKTGTVFADSLASLCLAIHSQCSFCRPTDSIFMRPARCLLVLPLLCGSSHCCRNPFGKGPLLISTFCTEFTHLGHHEESRWYSLLTPNPHKTCKCILNRGKEHTYFSRNVVNLKACFMRES